MGKGVLRISSDGDDQRNFGGVGLKCPITGFFEVGKLGKYFLVLFYFKRFFGGIENNLKIRGS